jgi:glycosyltransferase involved in cell wall biosynthesis
MSKNILRKIMNYVHANIEKFDSLTLMRCSKIGEDINELNKGLELLEKLGTDSAEKLISDIIEKKMWLKDGYDLENIIEGISKKFSVEKIPEKILYFVHSDLPYKTSGYTIRTQGVVNSLKNRGLDPEVVSRWGFPTDRNDFQADLEVKKLYVDENGISHHVDHSNMGMAELQNQEYIAEASQKLVEKCKSIKPSVIISASDHVTGLIGLVASRKLKIPFFYEMRGIWAFTRATNNPDYDGSFDYELRLRLEKQCALNADRVIVISEAMKRIVIKWGVKESKIRILHNGINMQKISNYKYKQLGSQKTLGYIGSIVPYEGLKTTIKSLKYIKDRNGSCPKFIIAGDGVEKHKLEEVVKYNDLEEEVNFLGVIPHDKIDSFYNSVDAIILPRLSTKVTDIVPPLKPLEGIERRKIIISSDINTHREIFDNINNSFQFKPDDIDSQSKEIIKYLKYDGKYETIIQDSLEYIVKNRNFEIMLQGVIIDIVDLFIDENSNDIAAIERILLKIKMDTIEINNLFNELYDTIIKRESSNKKPNIKLLSVILENKYKYDKSTSFENIDVIFKSEISKYKDNKIKRNIFLAILRKIGNINPSIASKFFDVYEELADKRSIRSAVTFKNRNGDYVNSLFLINKYSSILDDKFVNDVKKVAGRYSESYATSEDIPQIPILPDLKNINNREKINVACILDEFSYECFKYEVNMIKLTKENYNDVLNNQRIDFLFTESAWNGNDGEFIYSFAGSLKSNNAKRLQEIIEICNQNNIPTLFWNKEDPVNYEEFKKVAKKFDYILTSDENCISEYKKDCPDSKIGSLAFACQPVIHNPIRNTLPVLDLSFGGSWYVREHGKRKERLTTIINGAENYDLHIYDRNFGTENRNRFPPKFSKFVKGRLTYSQMRMAYRIYKIMLNTNSVEESNTMFSRRVFELMASSTAVVSTPSIGMEEMLPHAIVCESPEEIEKAIGDLLENDIGRLSLGHRGLRNVMNNHTYHHRMGEILQFLEIEDPYLKMEDNVPLVSIICCTNRPKMVENILKNYLSQKYKNLEMIVMLQAPQKQFTALKKRMEKIDGITVRRQLIKDSLGATFNKGFKYCKGEFIAKFDDDDLYGPNYLTDTIDAFGYTDADIIGKYGVFIYDEGSKKFYFRDRGINRYLQIVMGATIVGKREVFEQIKFPDKTTGEDTGFLKKCLENRFKIYSSNPFNWVLVRKSEQGFHTWDDQGQLVTGSVELTDMTLEKIFI